MLTVPLKLLPTLGKCLRLFRRHGSNWDRKNAKQEELKKTVFQYAGSNLQRADRVYAWGCSATGALGGL